jgi:hypothetical protein
MPSGRHQGPRPDSWAAPLGRWEPYSRSVARVDPENDGVRRFIVRHYRYDPDRHERRHVVVAAFDNKREFLACLEQVRAEIERRKNRGEHVDP